MMDKGPNTTPFFRQLFGIIDERLARLAARLGFTGNNLAASHVVGTAGSLLTHGATGHVAGNPGDVLYSGASGQWNRLAGHTTAGERKYLLLIGGASAALATGLQWSSMTTADIPRIEHNHDVTTTASGGALTNPIMDNYVEFRNIAAPTSATGARLYSKDVAGVSKLFYMGSDGVEVGPLAS